MKAGNIKNCLLAWSELTSDREVLNTVEGLPIDLDQEFEGLTSTIVQPQYPLGAEEHIHLWNRRLTGCFILELSVQPLMNLENLFPLFSFDPKTMNHSD